MSGKRESGFLARWSRLKQEARLVSESPSHTAPFETGATPSQLASTADPAAFDIATLDATADYSRFMQADVPTGLRALTLARLWHSDPAFARVDPLIDYAGDYTDAAVAVKDRVVTAYQIGRGFLSDEEAAEWLRLGRPPAPPEQTRSTEVDEAGAPPGPAAPARSEGGRNSDEPDAP